MRKRGKKTGKDSERMRRKEDSISLFVESWKETSLGIRGSLYKQKQVNINPFILMINSVVFQVKKLQWSLTKSKIPYLFSSSRKYS